MELSIREAHVVKVPGNATTVAAPPTLKRDVEDEEIHQVRSPPRVPVPGVGRCELDFHRNRRRLVKATAAGSPPRVDSAENRGGRLRA